jgi:hypothetical protein
MKQRRSWADTALVTHPVACHIEAQAESQNKMVPRILAAWDAVMVGEPSQVEEGEMFTLYPGWKQSYDGSQESVCVVGWIGLNTIKIKSP